MLCALGTLDDIRPTILNCSQKEISLWNWNLFKIYLPPPKEMYDPCNLIKICGFKQDYQRVAMYM